ncbi:T9SS type A sorting domain-containing protein [Flavobacterium sp. ASV13]|uniref:T9SS type A sorting domain-containing protein n=1 Tax=Flavobacterium sp. ASV13 TaxID=1506583 RepID=UPI0006917534|nr:T9SS type A sorting domain-containing protein [Flavobacterium sp. ASV13]
MKKKLLLIFLILFISQNIEAQTLDATLIELNFLRDSNPKNLTKAKTKIYFTANDGIHGTELWVYDDISKKTTLVKDISPGDRSSIDYPNFLVVGDNLYFIAKDETFKIGLWKSDGTEAGTYLIKYLNEYNTYSTYNLLNYNGKVVFFSKEEDDKSQSFWITDGTSQGTSLIKSFSNTYWQTIDNIKIFKNSIIFSASDTTNGQEIWISDGTPNGTKILKDINAGLSSSNPSNFFILNDNLFFSANNAEKGNELWKTDGTENGTFLLKDIDPSPYRSGIQSVNNFIVYNNAAYFYAKSNSNSLELWKSDGTISGTEMVKVIATGSNISYKLNGSVLNSGLVFSNSNYLTGTEIWKSDGTSNGTNLIKTKLSVPNDFADNPIFVSFNNKLYFSGGDSTQGNELWATDGTTEGTKLIQDIYPGELGSGIIKLTATSKYLFFAALDNKKQYRTLWLSDGISNGKLINEDINLSQFSNTELRFVELNNKVFFAGGYNSDNDVELWKTDLSTDITKVEKDINHTLGAFNSNSDFTNFNGKMIFAATNGKSGTEPFITDGTISGTKIIKNINPEDDRGSIYGDYEYRPFFTVAENNVFFRASDGKNGYELFKTDGTAENTGMVKDIAPGSGSSIDEFSLFMSNKNICYFKANDQVHGMELWRSDGTEAGTYILKDINPGSGHGVTDSNIFYDHDYIINEKLYAVLNGNLYFSAFDGNENSLWKTDGTSNGTTKAITITPSGVYDSRPAIINATNDKIFFKTNSNNSSYGNNSLWSTDGTQTGTVFLGLWEITGVGQFEKNIIYNNKLYFTTYNENGLALMVSDGTFAGTKILTKDHFTDYRSFGALKSCGKYVYFTLADSNGSGIEQELWKTDGTKEGTILVEKADIGVDYIHSCTCVQDNLFYLKRSRSKIWYVNNDTSTPAYYDIKITNAENFLENEGISRLISYGDNLLFNASTGISGYELYSTKIGKSLGTGGFDNNSSYKSITHLNLFPNPAASNGKLSISSDDNSTVESIEIYSILGTKIQSIAPNIETPLSINLNSLSKGLYLIKIKTEHYTETKKLIINK